MMIYTVHFLWCLLFAGVIVILDVVEDEQANNAMLYVSEPCFCAACWSVLCCGADY